MNTAEGDLTIKDIRKYLIAMIEFIMDGEKGKDCQDEHYMSDGQMVDWIIRQIFTLLQKLNDQD